MQVTEEQIARDLLMQGDDPHDPLARALYLEALEAVAPIHPQRNGGATLISQITAASRMSHGEIADLLGKSRATVQAYGSGRIPERFEAAELAKLKAMLEGQTAALASVISVIAKLQAGALH